MSAGHFSESVRLIVRYHNNTRNKFSWPKVNIFPIHHDYTCSLNIPIICSYLLDAKHVSTAVRYHDNLHTKKQYQEVVMITNIFYRESGDLDEENFLGSDLSPGSA